MKSFRTVVAGCSLGLAFVLSGCAEDNAKVAQEVVPKDQLGGIEVKAAKPSAPMVKGAITSDNYKDYMKATSSSPMQTKDYPGAKRK